MAAEGHRGGHKGADDLSDIEDFRTGEHQKGTQERFGIQQAELPPPPDELGMAQLTDVDGGCIRPMFSPDGTKIAYMTKGYPKEIWVMELDFSSGIPVVINTYNVTDAEVQCAHLESWSPDGTKILFRSSNFELWIAWADGSGVEKLLESPYCLGGPTYQASFSPDGTQIVYKNGTDIWKVNYDGLYATNPVQLTNNPDNCTQSPRWSPDGTMILYKICDASQRLGNYTWIDALWVMDPNGDNQRPVVEDFEFGLNVIFFGWSPDGEWIVYEYENENSDFQRDIYKVRVDGTDNTRLTLSDDYCEHTPMWMPDGNILYRSDELLVEEETPYSSTWVMRSDGSDKTAVNLWGGKWHDVSPTGEWIAIQTCEPFSVEAFSIQQTEGYGTEGPSQVFLVKNPLYVGPVGGEIIPLSLTTLIIFILMVGAALAIAASILVCKYKHPNIF